MFFRLPDIVIVSLIVFLVFEFVTNLEKKLECPNFNLTLFVPLIRLMYFEVIAIFVTNNPTRAQIFFKGLTRWVDVFRKSGPVVRRSKMKTLQTMIKHIHELFKIFV